MVQRKQENACRMELKNKRREIARKNMPHRLFCCKNICEIKQKVLK